MSDNENTSERNKSGQALQTPEAVAYGENFRGEGQQARDNRPKAGAMEVTVEHNIEKAMRVLKRKLIKEGLFRELKARRYYEKPSVRRKRKEKEAKKKARKDDIKKKGMSSIMG